MQTIGGPRRSERHVAEKDLQSMRAAAQSKSVMCEIHEAMRAEASRLSALMQQQMEQAVEKFKSENQDLRAQPNQDDFARDHFALFGEQPEPASRHDGSAIDGGETPGSVNQERGGADPEGSTGHGPLEADHAQLREEISNLKTLSAEAASREERTATRAQHLENKVEDMNAQKQHLENKVEDMNAQKHQMQEKIENMQRTMGDQEHTIKKLKKDNEVWRQADLVSNPVKNSPKIRYDTLAMLPQATASNADAA